jgi:hypothetical protein
MQLAGDPRPLLGDGRARCLLLLARQRLGPFPELGHLASAVGQPPAEAPRACEDEPAWQHLVDRIAVLESRHVNSQYGRGQGREPDARRRRAGVPPQGEHSKQHREPLGAARAAESRVDGTRTEHHEQGRERDADGGQDRQRVQQRDHRVERPPADVVPVRGRPDLDLRDEREQADGGRQRRTRRPGPVERLGHRLNLATAQVLGVHLEADAPRLTTREPDRS